MTKFPLRVECLHPEIGVYLVGIVMVVWHQVIGMAGIGKG